MILRVDSGQIMPGETITLAVQALNVPMPGLGATTIELRYDPAVVDAVTCRANPQSNFDLGACNVNYDNDGINPDSVRFNLTSLSGVSGNPLLAHVAFRASSAAGGATRLDVVKIVFADPSGVPMPTIEEAGQIAIGTLGDVNCDRLANVIDAMFVLQYDVGLRTASNQCPPPAGALYTPTCDVNHDGSCNVVDGLFILQCDVGIHNDFCPANGLRWLRTDTPAGLATQPAAVSSLNVGSGEVAPGGSLVVPVTAELGDGALLGAGTIEVRYDPAVVDAVACVADPAGVFDAKSCNVNYEHDGVYPDTVRFNTVSLTGVTGTQVLADITFQAVGAAGAHSILDGVTVVFADPNGATLSAIDRDGQICITPCGPTPLPTAVATLAPTSPTTLTLPGGWGQVSLPAGLVTSTTTFTYTQIVTPTQATGGFTFAGRSFTLVATDAAGQPVTSFAGRYTITLNYQDADWQAAGIPAEANLNLYYWNEATWVALLPCAGCSLDTVNNRVTVVLDHLTEFALLGKPWLNWIYLPLVRKGN